MSAASSTAGQSRVRTVLTQSAVVSRKEFAAAVRARSLQLLLVVLLVTTGLVFRVVDGSTDSPAAAVVELLGLSVQLVVPIAAVLAAASSVSGERDSGSLRLLLGLPISRSEVVFGKFFGLFAALSVGLGVVFASVVVLSYVTVGSVPLSALGGLMAAALLLAGAFGGLAVGVSAAVATTRRSIAAAVGGLFVLVFLWEPLIGGAYYAVTGGLPAEPSPLLLFVERLNPLNAFAVAAGTLGVGSVFPLRLTFGLVGYGGGTILTGPDGGSTPMYVSDPVSLVVLLGWIVVPLAVGVLRFRSVDLTIATRVS